MTPTLKQVRLAFRARYQATIGVALGAVSWEGPVFQPAVGQPYVRETLKPGQSSRHGIGPGSLHRHGGIWLLDVFRPRQEAVTAGDLAAEALLEAFPPGLGLAAGGRTVRILNSSKAALPPKTDWRQFPVTITYQYDTILPE